MYNRDDEPHHRSLRFSYVTGNLLDFQYFCVYKSNLEILGYKHLEEKNLI